MTNRLLHFCTVAAGLLFLFGCSKNPNIEAPGAETAAKEEPPDAILRAYLEAPLWQDRIEFVRDSERVRKCMQEVYGKQYKPFPITNIRIFPSNDENLPNGWRAFIAEWDDTSSNSKGGVKYFLLLSSGGWKVDWESALGYNPLRLSVFVAKRDPDPVTFRVSCTLDNYYNYEFRETRSTHVSVSIVADGKRIHGYASKNSPDGARLLNLLQDGQPHPLTLELQHIGPFGEAMSTSQSSGEVVTINKVVSDSWILAN